MVGHTVNPVLLLESDENVIKDVTCCLRIIDIPVVSAISIEEALEAIQEHSPALVIARLRIADDERAAETLQKRISLIENFEAPPVYALCSPGEQHLIGESEQPFSGNFALPVEFPAFPEQVKNIISGTARDALPGETDPARAVTARNVRQNIPDAAPQQEINPEVQDRNYAVAHAIQSKVLRELELDGRINHARPEQVPGIVNQITAKVCVRYATEKFL